jgi:hypothetical protein
MDFDGQVVWERASLVEIPANSSRDYFNENKYEFLLRKDTRKLVPYCRTDRRRDKVHFKKQFLLQAL